MRLLDGVIDKIKLEIVSDNRIMGLRMTVQVFMRIEIAEINRLLQIHTFQNFNFCFQKIQSMILRKINSAQILISSLGFNYYPTNLSNLSIKCRLRIGNANREIE